VRQTETGPFDMRAVPLHRVAGELAEADVVLTAVAAESHVLSATDFAGVPRNVEPSVAALAGVTLLDMDTLSVSVARALGDRAEESVAARGIVADEVDRYRSASRQRGAAPIIASLRGRLETLRVAELERHRAQLADLSEEE